MRDLFRGYYLAEALSLREKAFVPLVEVDCASEHRLSRKVESRNSGDASILEVKAKGLF